MIAFPFISLLISLLEFSNLDSKIRSKTLIFLSIFSNDMFTEGIKKTGYPPKYILYVGNNYLKDIVPAANIGLQTAYKINTPLTKV